MKPIHGAPQPKNMPSDMVDAPPIPCCLRPGDIVTYTNDYGVKFQARVRGFMQRLRTYTVSVGLLNTEGRIVNRMEKTYVSPDFVYLEFWRNNKWSTEGSAWWCAHRLDQLTLI